MLGKTYVVAFRHKGQKCTFCLTNVHLFSGTGVSVWQNLRGGI